MDPPIADFVIVTDSLAGLKEAIGRVEDMAMAQEKLVLRTRIFGYDRKRLQALKALDYKVGASIPGAVSLDRCVDPRCCIPRLKEV